MTDVSLEDVLRRELRIVDDRYSPPSDWHVERIGDRHYRIPVTLGFAEAMLMVERRVGLHDRDDALGEFLHGTGYEAEEPDYADADAIFSRLSDKIDRVTSCESLAVAVLDAVAAWEESFDIEHVPNDALEAVASQAEMFGDAPPTDKFRQRARVAAVNAYARSREVASLAYRRERDGRIAEFERDRASRLNAIKEQVIAHVTSHMDAFATVEDGTPVNPVAHYLSRRAGLTFDQIGRAYGVTRQGAAHYVNGGRPAPKLSGERLKHFMDALKGYRADMQARLEAIEKVIDDGIT